MIIVLAEIELASGTREAFLGEFRALMPHVHQEDGCLEYGPAIDATTPLTKQALLGPDRVMIVEKWRDVPALEAHLVAPHMTGYRERVKDYVKETKLTILDPCG